MTNSSYTLVKYEHFISSFVYCTLSSLFNVDDFASGEANGAKVCLPYLEMIPFVPFCSNSDSVAMKTIPSIDNFKLQFQVTSLCNHVSFVCLFRTQHRIGVVSKYCCSCCISIFFYFAILCVPSFSVQFNPLNAISLEYPSFTSLQFTSNQFSLLIQLINKFI